MSNNQFEKSYYIYPRNCTMLLTYSIKLAYYIGLIDSITLYNCIETNKYYIICATV